MGESEKLETPDRDSDFYYPLEYTAENIQREFLFELENSNFQPEDKERIWRGYELAIELHRGQTRREARHLPYIVHPIEVALAVLRAGGSPDSVIAALLHDVREDSEWLQKLDNGEIAKKFESRVVEVLTRLLSKYRFECDEVVKLSPKEYFSRLSGDSTAVWIKALDRRVNLMSLGRMLGRVSSDDPEYSEFTLQFVKKQILETREIVIPVVRAKYEKLADNLEKLTNKLATRLALAETFIAESTAQFSKSPVSTRRGA